MHPKSVIEAIDKAPLNRGLKGIDWCADPRNVAIVEGDDIVLFDYESPGIYQVHLLLDRSRGRAAVDYVQSAIRALFDRHGAETVFALVPDFRREVKLIARWVGGTLCGKRATVDGVCELYVLQKGQLP